MAHSFHFSGHYIFMVARIVTLTNHLGTSQLPCWLPQVRYRLDNGGQHSSCRPAQQAEPSCQLPGEVQAVTAARLCVVYTKCHSLLTSGQGWNYIIKVLKILQILKFQEKITLT